MSSTRQHYQSSLRRRPCAHVNTYMDCTKGPAVRDTPCMHGDKLIRQQAGPGPARHTLLCVLISVITGTMAGRPRAARASGRPPYPARAGGTRERARSYPGDHRRKAPWPLRGRSRSPILHAWTSSQEIMAMRFVSAESCARAQGPCMPPPPASPPYKLTPPRGYPAGDGRAVGPECRIHRTVISYTPSI